ncbi:CHRD domain-containing protein [Ilyomonas limi]|uniref:CHRD domain-containing protein n=2 Tax=Ilyomonas limi TaxID=2575867 RepID=A0A4U3L5H3_9BACT|nr:CHRD domain-containing protein [Ilyomonas limi]
MQKRPMTSLRSGIVLLSAFFCLSTACSKNDDDNNPPATNANFAASLSGSQETPPNAETGTGTLTATYDANSNKLSYTLTWTGLTGAPTAMHFHKGQVGEPGDVEIPIAGFTAAAAGTLTATATVDEDEEEDLMEGHFYVNIHTANYQAGEIRGQVLKQ